MAFSKDDIYTSSGSVMLQNFWTPYVSKYDTSSFYNWEQDNLPLYDLEERTYLLWEQQGFTTSAGVPGLSLTVSADTPALTLAQNSTIFTNVSSCIAAVPKVVRFPVLIEVCNFGDLGKLELHNFRIEEGGSIEIINRAAVKAYSESTKVISTTTPTYNAFADIVNQVSSLDLSSSLYATPSDETCTSSLILSATVLSSAGDIRVNEVNTFLYPSFITRRGPLSVSLKNSSFLTGTLEEFSITPYESTNTDQTISTFDMSSTSQDTEADILRDSASVDTLETGFVYLNSLSKISVKNCDGPIYLRNFCVNGEATATTGTRVGIEITNSDVLLENCSASKCKEAGFKFNNSKIILSRSAFAYRNYDLSSATGRIENTGIGFHAINSDVSISALFSATTETGVAGDFQASGEDNIIAASRNHNGFVLDNSKLHGGVQRISVGEKSSGLLTSEQNTGHGMVCNNSEVDLLGLLDFYGNNIGVYLKNSLLSYENLCVEDQHKEGVLAENSVITLKPVSSNFSQTYRYQEDFRTNGQHIKLQNQSTKDFIRVDHIPEVYGSLVYLNCHGGDGATYASPAISVLDNSKLSLIHPHIDTKNITLVDIPCYGLGIKTQNNSQTSLFGSENAASFVWGPAGVDSQVYVAGLYAKNNSEVNIHGPTVIAQFGVDVLAEDNSVINIEPPKIPGTDSLAVRAFDLSSQGNHTSVELHATRSCLVANKQSTINLENLGGAPTHWPTAASGQFMVSEGYDNPVINSINQYIGSGSLQFYPNPGDSQAISFVESDDLTASISFNPGTIPTTFTQHIPSKVNSCLVNTDPFGGTFGDRALVTLGGTCVRAVGDSVVNVNNVHFPLGSADSTLDGVYYTTSGTACEKYGIWNIADTSRLHASYISVSGMYPADAQYHGPSALWGSSVDGTSTDPVIASGAPIRTPDTGSLSILDSFGAGSSVWVIPSGVSFNSPLDSFYPLSGIVNEQTASYLAGAGINVSSTTTRVYGAGEHVSNNRGPFRIYWSPKASAKVLQTDLSGFMEGAYPHTGNFYGVVGPAYQIFAQGYNCSAPLSAIVPTGATNASADFPDLLKLSYDADGDGIPDSLWTSGFYYCSEFLEEDPTQCMLDESASNTFANSKNASLGSSGRPKKVTITRSRANTYRGAESYIGDASGSVGYKSASTFDLKRDN